MKRVATKVVKFSRIKLPGDWKQRLASPRVKDLADSFDSIPLLQRPGLAKDMRVIYGTDRLAAIHLLGRSTVDVDVWEATAEEIADARDTENARRRDRDAAALKRLIDREQVKVEEERAAPPPKPQRVRVEDDAGNEIATGGGGWGDDENDRTREASTEDNQEVAPAEPGTPVPGSKPGPERSSRREAQERIASKMGISPAAAKKADQRTNGHGRQKHDDGAAPLEAPFDTHGLVTPVAHVAAWKLIADTVSTVDKLLQRAQVELTTAAKAIEAAPEGARLKAGRLLELRLRIKELAGLVRAERPAALCPYCCMVAGHTEDCPACQGGGYLVEAQAANAPKELDYSRIYVARKGKQALVPLAEIGR